MNSLTETELQAVLNSMAVSKEKDNVENPFKHSVQLGTSKDGDVCEAEHNLFKAVKQILNASKDKDVIIKALQFVVTMRIKKVI